MLKPNVSASIVIYHNPIEQLLKAINSFLHTSLSVKLYLIDNSSNDTLRELQSVDERIEYIFNDKNLGYGTAHNIAMRKSMASSIPYHLVLNPDIYFDDGVLEELYSYMESNKDIGNIMPQILYPNDSIQHLCKLLPTPFDLIFRRFIPFQKWKKKRNEKYELIFSGYNQIMNIPYLSGCFMFLRTSVLYEIGLFDENIFMYFEDTDLTRRIFKKYRTIFYPYVSVYHEYSKESYVSKKLLFYHIKAAIYYFNKWGWVFDEERQSINVKLLKTLKHGGS